MWPLKVCASTAVSRASEKVLDKVLFKSVVAGHNFHLMFLGLVLIFPSGRFSHQGT